MNTGLFRIAALRLHPSRNGWTKNGRSCQRPASNRGTTSQPRSRRYWAIIGSFLNCATANRSLARLAATTLAEAMHVLDARGDVRHHARSEPRGEPPAWRPPHDPVEECPGPEGVGHPRAALHHAGTDDLREVGVVEERANPRLALVVPDVARVDPGHAPPDHDAPPARLRRAPDLDRSARADALEQLVGTEPDAAHRPSV